ncbi:hypothetical protein [Rubidibacter lacunae]|nr:hypothetical protein [Rubidibacter lacunae]
MQPSPTIELPTALSAIAIGPYPLQGCTRAIVTVEFSEVTAI